MKNFVKLPVIVLSLVICGLGQSSGDHSAQGAKALYYDQTSSTTLQTDEAHASKRPSLKAQRVNTGLKYWVELVQPDSPQILRVNSTRAFHSGERIRLHFESNVDGRIVLVQMNPNGTSQMLFPDHRINEGDNHIKAGADLIVPAENAWFTLDNNPGIERVMVFLNVDADPQVTAPHRTESRPASSAGTEIVAGNVPPSLADGKLDAGTTAVLAAKVEKQQGGKSLFLEVDDKSEAPANYAVKPASYRTNNRTDKEALAIEIQLKHQ